MHEDRPAVLSLCLSGNILSNLGAGKEKNRGVKVSSLYWATGGLLPHTDELKQAAPGFIFLSPAGIVLD